MKARRFHARGPGSNGGKAHCSRICECGESRVNVDGTVTAACPRCSLLDGTRLSPSARALISELRQLGRATWDAIVLELPEYDRRSLQRAIALLNKLGRVRRITIERPDITSPDFRRGWATRKDRSVTSRLDTLSIVAAFELVEPR